MNTKDFPTIRETLELQRATLEKLIVSTGENGITLSLIVKAPLSVEASKVLKCEERFFNLNETAYRDYRGRITLKHFIVACKVMIGGDEELALSAALLPDMVSRFSIGLDNDIPSVMFRLDFDRTWRETLIQIVDALNISEFQIRIVSLQQSLFAESQEDEVSTQMELGENEYEAEPEYDPESEGSVEPGNTLPSVRAMAGGTTAKAKGRKLHQVN